MGNIGCAPIWGLRETPSDDRTGSAGYWWLCGEDAAARAKGDAAIMARCRSVGRASAGTGEANSISLGSAHPTSVARAIRMLESIEVRLRSLEGGRHGVRRIRALPEVGEMVSSGNQEDSSMYGSCERVVEERTVWIDPARFAERGQNRR